MDVETRRRLLEQSEPLIEEDNWIRIENIWQPYILLDDADAKSKVSLLYFEHGFDEGEPKNDLMHSWLMQAAHGGDAKAAYCAAICTASAKDRDHLFSIPAEHGCLLPNVR